jgi:hypothetical protein
MFHYIYKTIDKNGKYYIGRHSTNNLEDGYMGSGVWVKKHKDKTRLKKIIVEFCETFDDLLQKEQKYINEHIDDPHNMNFNNSSSGWAFGHLNIAHRKDVKEKLRSRMLSDNPMKNGHKEESKEKIKLAMLGSNNPFYGKSHSIETREKISKKNTGKVWNETQRKNLSEVRKKQFDGQRPSYLFCSEHTEDTKEKIRQSALNREKISCPFCHKLSAPHVAKRWHFDNCKRKRSES